MFQVIPQIMPLQRRLVPLLAHWKIFFIDTLHRVSMTYEHIALKWFSAKTSHYFRCRAVWYYHLLMVYLIYFKEIPSVCMRTFLSHRERMTFMETYSRLFILHQCIFFGTIPLCQHTVSMFNLTFGTFLHLLLSLCQLN